MKIPFQFSVLWALWAMARPLQVMAVMAVALTGSFIAIASGANINLTRIAAGLIALLPVAISIHYANEYADAETDALTTRTPFSGGSGALVAMPDLHIWAGRLMLIWLILGFVLAFWLRLPKPAIVVLGVGAFGGWMYSLPPLRLAWRGWGELTNALLGSTALMSYGYALLTGQVDAFILLASIPFTALVFINLLATTWPDRIADAQVGKMTLATSWSVPHLRRLYLLCAALALGSLLILCADTIPSELHWMLIPVVPLLFWGAVRYTRHESPAPTVFTMIAAMIGQITIWGGVALGLLSW